ncbi:hypothetical protein EPN28_03455 [Patescibacteria group bacterium]|nr:MAG: hypothetical protein EPN28_03455 [Patescibacteria group bacterium]
MPDISEEKPLAAVEEKPATENETETPQADPAVVEVEQAPETDEKKPEAEPARTEAVSKPRFSPFKKPALHLPQSRDEVTMKIEKILEDGLNEPYQRLSPIARKEFKLKGEQTAAKIRELMRSARVKAKKILRLILEWLKMLPGINKFFLEQEAKIKTDKIMALKRVS